MRRTPLPPVSSPGHHEPSGHHGRHGPHRGPRRTWGRWGRWAAPLVGSAVAATLLAVAAPPSGAGAQEVEFRGPDSAAAADTTPIRLPRHDERTLSSGLRVIVVPDPDAEVTTYTMFVPGGSAADPPGKEGTAALLAALMGSVDADDPGMTLGVTASADAMALTLVDSIGRPGGSARRLGDAIRRAPVTDSTVAEVRRTRSEQVAQLLQRPDVAANRALLRAVYGDHPYGRAETPASLARIEVGDVQAFRDRHLRPDGAVLSVTGAVESGSLLRVVEEGLEGWDADPGPPPEPASEPLPSGAGGRRILMHRPGLSAAVIHFGIDLPDATDRDWTPLAVLEAALTARPDEPLVTVEPPGASEGIVAGTATAAQRRRGPGLFQGRASVQTGVAADVVRGLLDGLAGAGGSFLTPSVLRPVQARLARSFRGQVSVPEGAGALMAVNRVLGLPDSLMTSYPVRVGRVGPQDVRDVAARHLDTARVSVVVMGDATLLRRDLEALGSFELVDLDGGALAAEELEAVEESPSFDASSLGHVRLEYRVMVQDQQAGTVTRVLEAGPDSLPGTLRFRSEAELGGQIVTQSVTFTTPGFRAVAAASSVTSRGQSAGMSVRVEGGRVTGSVDAGAGVGRDIDVAMPEGALLGDMLELAVWLAPLQASGEGSAGTAWRVDVVAPESGTVSPVVLRVGGSEEVTSPAGSFTTRRVEVGGDQPQSYWVAVERPRVPVRIAPAGRPVTLELVSVRTGEPVEGGR